VEDTAQKTWKPTVAGILMIIISLAGAVYSVIVLASETEPEFLLFYGIALFLSVVALTGGIYSLLRKLWWLALTGSIIATLSPVTFLGIPTLIFIALSKDEFE
jgi:hypothetical protein